MKLREFKRLNAASGYFWFNPNTLQFWHSTIPLWDDVTGHFVSREKTGFYASADYRYTLRKANFVTGEVDTVGRFQEYETLYLAKRAWLNCALLRDEKSDSRWA